MLDPGARWGPTGRPDYAGLLTYAGMPYTEDPDELEGVDVAILGLLDDLVSDRPGTRYGPRAIRDASLGTGTHLEAQVNPFTDLRDRLRRCAGRPGRCAALTPGDRGHRWRRGTCRRRPTCFGRRPLDR